MPSAKVQTKPTTIYRPRLQSLYMDKIRYDLMRQLNLDNINQVPRLEKVVINTGLGNAKDDNKIMQTANNTLRKVTGQQPVPTTAKKSIATFKLREGNKIGLKVTLRGAKMYEFTDRLISIVLPRLRDFHGVKTISFDKQGNYALGLTDQTVFPELSFEETNPAHGMQVIFVIKAEAIEHARALLTQLGMPFEKEKKTNG